MTTWAKLYANHRKLRTETDGRFETEIRKQLTKLVDAGHCAFARFSYRTNKKHKGLEAWEIKSTKDCDGLRLLNVDGFASIRFQVQVLFERRSNHLRALMAMAECVRTDGSPCVIAVHMPDDGPGDQQGLGACGHAAFHCHIGPSLDVKPQVRVPLPALSPSEVAQWVISQVVQDQAFEPAPWDSVNKALRDSQAIGADEH